MEPYASRIEAVLARRAEAGRYAPGLAAYSDSDMFKKPPVSQDPIHRLCPLSQEGSLIHCPFCFVLFIVFPVSPHEEKRP